MVSKMSLKAFMSECRVGLILRTFAKKQSQVKDRLEMIQKIIEKIRPIMFMEKQLIRRIDVVVWNDERYFDFVDGQSVPAADCGATTETLRDVYKNDKLINMSQVRQGDLFCGALNYGLELQKKYRITHSLIVSAEASSYINQENLENMIVAMCRGALVSGLAITELTQSILEGRIANT